MTQGYFGGSVFFLCAIHDIHHLSSLAYKRLCSAIQDILDEYQTGVAICIFLNSTLEAILRPPILALWR